jgi:hypothetical protein
MWLTGFDVGCLSTLDIDKPMKARTLMQAIARANLVYPGKDFGLRPAVGVRCMVCVRTGKQMPSHVSA